MQQTGRKIDLQAIRLFWILLCGYHYTVYRCGNPLLSTPVHFFIRNEYEVSVITGLIHDCFIVQRHSQTAPYRLLGQETVSDPTF